jgi:hypothetical protein
MKGGSVQYIVDVLEPRTQINLSYPVYDWEAAESGRGSQQRATYSVLFESYIPNTGSFLRDAKASGK